MNRFIMLLNVNKVFYADDFPRENMEAQYPTPLAVYIPHIYSAYFPLKLTKVYP